jgi:hypothetical protein
MQQPHRRLPALALALLVTVLLPACTALGPRHYATWQTDLPSQTATPDPAPPDSLDFHGIPIRSGQLVVSEQGSPLGLLMSLLIADASPWIHVGIIAIEAGVPYLYESNGQIRPTWSSDPPTATVGGGVRRLSLEWFVANQSYIAIYAPPAGADPARIVEFARQSHARHIPFDAWFDLDDASRMYCTEFVALALAAADAPPVRTSAMNPNPSIRVLADWLQVRADTIIPANALIEHSERIALISKHHSPAQFMAWFSLKQELHRRFTADQKVGNALSFSAFTGLGFQTPVGDVIRSVDRAARDWGTLTEPEIDARVRQIAGETLGPWSQK